MRRRLCEPGIGLIEVLIAAALGLVLLGLLHQMLVPVMRANSKTTVKVNLRLEATRTLAHLAEDLQGCGGTGLSYQPATSSGRSLLAISSPTDITSSGRKVYEQRLLGYSWDPSSKEVRRADWTESSGLGLTIDPSRPTILEPLELARLSSERNMGRLLASGVEEFVPLDNWPPEPCNTSVLVIARQYGPNQTLTLTVRRSISFRNG
jgi:hypothetical protein